MRIFLAGIMQGSHLGAVLHSQDYRERLKKLLPQYLPEAEIYDPLADHSSSLDYDADQGRQVFMHHNQMCSEIDVLIAFVPEASMGTAIEMWEAYRHGRVVLAISPLEHNWAIRFLSHEIFPDIEAFEQALVSGKVAEQIVEIRESGK